MRSGSIPMTPCAKCAVIPLPNDVQSRDLIAETGLCVWCAPAKPADPQPTAPARDYGEPQWLQDKRAYEEAARWW